MRCDISRRRRAHIREVALHGWSRAAGVLLLLLGAAQMTLDLIFPSVLLRLHFNVIACQRYVHTIFNIYRVCAAFCGTLWHIQYARQ